QVELHGGDRRALGDSRGLVLDPVHPGDGVFDLLSDLHLQLRGRRAGLADTHLHDWHIDVGEAGDGQIAEAEPAERDQHQEKHERRYGPANRPGGDVPVHHCVSVLAAVAAGTGRTVSPSRRKVPARATTRSPSASPSRTSTRAPAASPTLMARVSTRLPRTTC